ncbi:hypothetical protein PR202_ga30354 [Eleusine coracana subsp. coracana]|uniref:FBD domain-containing protein n=1 Tax=Eleusine coracana subsp. coracana TaxID=191504 RepID=A0AAV5DM38_ELECO|nr:hypothetical protein PR202_ga30354 [Eleusine coracana subsp. coracana]
MNEFPGEVARWLKLLAVKGVQELFLINPPWPIEALKKHMPATIFSMATLTRLYLGFWRFPDTAVLPRGAAFPCLRELGLCSLVIDAKDIDFVLSRSPVLDILSIQGHLFPSLRLRLVSQSLQCVQIYASEVESVAVVDAPRLERLILSKRSDLTCKIKIGRAPALRFFGSFDMGKDELRVGNTIIKAGIPVNPCAMVTTIEVLALPVPFGVRSSVKMLPSLLRCFPNLKTLHIHSKNTTESTGRLNLKFWQESGAIECVQSHITMLAFHNFQGERSEVAFLKFFVESSKLLKVLVVEFANGCVSSMAEAKAQVKALFAGKRGCERCSVVVTENRLEGGAMWTFERGSEMSDPFGLFQSSSYYLAAVQLSPTLLC